MSEVVRSQQISQLTPEQRQALLQKVAQKRAAAAAEERIPRRAPGEGPLPLSFAQQRLWLVDRMQPGSPAYNLPFALRLRGALDAVALRASLDALVARHESLRTTFAEQGGGPVQVVHPAGAADLREIDLRSSADAGAEAARLAAEETLRPFDLARGPLLRSTLLRLGEADHVLLFTLHHIVSDGWSMEVLVREVSALYEGFARGAEARLPELPVQYGDYALWQRNRLVGDTLERELAWWRERLADAPPLLELPADGPRTAGLDAPAATHRHALPAELAEGLRALAGREGATLFMVLLAGWQALLGRYAGQDDVVVGTPVAGRGRQETEGLIGFFVNMLALRADLSGDPTWGELLGRVRETALGAYAHQELPFERVVDEVVTERSLTHAPLFQVTFAVERAGGGDGALKLGEVGLEPFTAGGAVAKFDLELTVVDGDEGMAAVLVYHAGLFEADTIARMAGHLETLLRAMVEDTGRRVSDAALLRGDERARVLEAWNATAAEFPREQCVHGLFAVQAARTPGAVAVVFGDRALTYAELDGRANRLAHALRRRGVGPETRVGLFLERGPEQVVALLGALKAGGAYVPLDAGYPRERLAHMLSDGRVSVLVTRESLRERLPGSGAAVLCLDGEQDEIARESGEAPAVVADPENLAYVLYTSGSTGRPKGVAVPHRGVVNYLTWAAGAYGVGDGTRAPVHSPLSFDLTVTSLLLPLVSGGTVDLVPEAEGVEGLSSRLRAGGFGLVKLTPAHLALLERQLSTGEAAVASRTYVVGGEAFTPESAGAWLRLAPESALVNEYGPTETVVGCCVHRVEPGDGAGATVPIGRPIANTRLYVLDRGGSPVPVGVAGELLIGGAGVARGYLGRPELTAEKFVPDAFSGEAGARLYRTGDRVRWRADGKLEYLGRTDTQVKVRGYRIEPGEVEAVLAAHPRVRETVVVVREDTPGQKQLVAYVVAQDAEIPAAELRGHLRERLPEYMVPTAFVALDALPLTPTGKVDRRALPAPEHGGEGGYVAPRTAAEEVLAGIWAEVLKTERVGAEQSFFELGGHSLLATRVVSRVREVFGIELPLRAVFEAPTVAGLAARIEALRHSGASVGAPPLERAPRGGALPLSFAQQRLWVVDRLEPNTPAYNIPFALRLRGSLDVDALGASIDALVARHESLRTTFAEQDGAPVQVVQPAGRGELRVVELRGAPDAEAEAERWAAEEALRPFDLARGPLLRTTLLCLADDDHVLCCTLHHIVSDGWSTEVLVREVSALYAAFRFGEAPALPELPVQYADYAVWQREWFSGEVLEAQLQYWKGRLAGAPPLLEVPTDRPRVAGQSLRAGYHSLSLTAELTRGLRALSRREGTTLFMTVLAGWQALLSRYSGQEDVVVGSPIAGRSRLETEGLIGFFVNMLALRGELDGDPTFAGLLARARETALGAYAHQDLPFERLVDELATERSLTHTPIFQTVFSLDRSNGVKQLLRLGEAELEPFAPGLGSARFELNLSLDDSGEEVTGGLLYRAALFEPATAERMLGHLEAVLAAMAEDPALRISEVALLRKAERTQVLEAWNATDRPFSDGACLHQLIEWQAARAPDAVAVTAGAASLTYAELDRRANQVAHVLRRHGVGPESRLALFLEPSPEMVVAVLGVLKAGGAYVPLDTASPPERLAFLLEDSGAALVLADSATAPALPAGGPPVLVVTANAFAAEPQTKPESGVGPENLAYVIYTSGSTGQPKGVLVPHRGVCNSTEAYVSIYGIRPGSRVLLFAPLHFDASVLDLFTALCSGATLVVASRDALMPGDGLTELLGRERITHLKITPSALSVTPPAELPELEAVMVGGEASSAELVSRWAPGRRFFNGYGATEHSVRCTFHRCTDLTAPPPVGRPIANARLYVLDAGLQPVPVGVPGEVYMAGLPVTRGYLNRPGLTAERFVPDPFRGVPGARMYRSGDRGRWLADGTLEFVGRVDFQLKIRGFRIEPGEIEAALLEHGPVRDAVVVAREDVPGEKRLVAYVAVEEGAEVSAAELRGHLASRLPEYMVPAAFVMLEALPLTANGKIDRRGLPAPQWGGDAEAYVAPRTAVEELLCDVWAEVLRLERVGVEESFFELGGDSILSIQVVARARRHGLRLTPRQLFERPTIARLAEVVEWVDAGACAAQGAVAGEAPLTPAQRRFFAEIPPAPHLFLQSVLLQPREALDPALLERALAALLAHHDALRLRFRRDAANTWTQVHAQAGEPVEVKVTSLAHLTPAARQIALEALGAGIQATLDPEHGPLLRAAWFDLGQGDPGRLLLVAHHLVVDGVSWRILLEDLETACTQLARGEAVRLPAKTTSWKSWAEGLEAQARSAALAEEAAYWVEQARKEVVRLPARAAAMGAAAREGSVQVNLTGAETQALLREVPQAYRTRIDEVLLCALVRAMERWTGERRVRVDLEGHGREEARVEGADLSRTVGWFTNVYPVVLEVPGGGDEGAALKAVKEQLRAVPGKGMGYGLLRWMSGTGAGAELAAAPKAEVAFNYLGQFDQTVSRDAFFAFAQESAGTVGGEANGRGYRLQVAGAVHGGRLDVTFVYGEGVHRRETIERLAGWYADELRALVAHCTSAAAGGYTPSDFPLAALGQAELDALLGSGRGVDDVYPLTPMQEGILFHALSSDESGMYVGQSGFVLVGTLDPGALRRAWQGVVSRHEALRAGFEWEGVRRPVQVIRAEAELPFRHEDWRELDEAGQRAALDAYLREDGVRSFDVRTAPLMRLGLFRTGDREHQLIWTHHHLIVDGWSLSLLFRDVLELYQAYARGETPRLSEGRRFRDYLAWLAEQDLAAAERHWTEALRGITAPTPLPMVRAKSSGEEGTGEVWRSLAGERTAVLQEQARRSGVTLNTVVQGAWALLLASYAGEDEVVFGATVSGRPAELPGVEDVVGLFINTLPVRVRVDGEATLREWLERLQAEQVTAREYEYSPLSEVQKWSDVPGGQPLFESLVVFENYPVEKGLGEDLSELEVRRGVVAEQTSYPLMVVAHPQAQLTVQLHYERGRVDAGTAERLVDQLAAVLEAMAAGPGRRLPELSLLGEAERSRLLESWSAPAPVYAQGCIHELFAAQAARTPGAVALAYEGGSLTYGELDRRSARLAGALRRRGVGPEVRVALCAERSPELVVGILAILRAGGAYVPVDPGYPADRIAYLLEDSGCAAVLVKEGFRAVLPRTDAQVILLEEVLADAASGAEVSGADVHPENAAYVIYTSGSTGKPKGVVVTHGNVTRLFDATREWFGFGPDDVWTLFHSYAFDFSVWEIWGALLYGGRLVVVPFATSRSPEEFYELLVGEGVTVLNQTPSAFRQLAAVEESRGAPAGDLALRYVVFGGEALELRALRGWMERHGEERPRLVNMYGITETTVHVTYRPITRADVEAGEVSPIGVPIPDLTTRVLDRWGSPVPVGVPGEMYVGGAGVARGYLGRPELTAQRFLPDALGSVPGARLYRSGDRVRRLPTGELEYLGRTDAQVKVRGFRIEPGEIEAALLEHEQVREAVVLVREDEPGQKRLVAYLVAEPGAALEVAEVRIRLRARLPEHMVPAVLTVLERLPLTAHGKVDRRALPVPEGAVAADEAYVAPQSQVEQVLAAIWSEVLMAERVGIHDNFFDLGGDSILSIQVVARARQRGLRLSPRQLFERPTIARLAEVVERVDAGAAGAAQGPVTGEAPVTPIQQRFFAFDQPAPHHFNQSLLLRPRDALAPAVLDRAVACVEAHHDALRLRFRRESGAWVQTHAPAEERAPLATVDLSRLAGRAWKGAMEAAADQVQRSLELARGPLLRTAWFDPGRGEPGRLLMAAHHLVVDGVSWRILLEDLETAYTQIARGEAVRLPAKTTSWKSWAEGLAAQARSAALAEEAAYWVEQAREEVAALPADDPAGRNTTGGARRVAVRLTEAETQALLREVPQAYHTGIDDVLLCALVRAMERWTGERRVRVDLEGHGREEARVEGADLSRTVGWFTNVYPVVLEVPGGGDEGAALKAVKEQLRAVPGKGMGYGLLRWMSGTGAGAELAAAPKAEVAFNYLGQFDQTVSRDAFFAFAQESAGAEVDDRAERAHRLQVSGMVHGGSLDLGFVYGEGVHRRETIERLAGWYADELRGLIEHCRSDEAGGYTPSDFPLVDIDEATLALLEEE